MRFVIGLLSGAAVILLLAQVSGMDRAHWLDRVPGWFDRLAGAAGEVLALPPRPPTPTPPPQTALTRPAAADAVDPAPLPAREPIPRPPDTRAPDEPDPSQAELGPSLAGAAAVDGVDGAEDARGAADERPEDAEDVERIVAAVFGVPPVPEPASGVADARADPSELLAAAENASQPVWVPFHSRMSADGFAEQLSASLGHPFRVERRGPGRYQVVFGYRDEPQRLALLAQAAELTGLEL